MVLTLQYGKRIVEVSLTVSARKYLSITVHPDCRVTANAPDDQSVEVIEARIRRRLKWITEQLRFFEDHQPRSAPRQYVNGATHLYLGRQYRLRIRKGKKNGIRLIGGFFEMELVEPRDGEAVKRLLDDWYRGHAREAIARRVALYLPRFLSRGAREPEIRYRLMKKRWGSCSAKGVILFNTELARASVYCMDYVIVHELCHLLQPNHNNAFYQLLKQVLPDWERRKERLEKALL
jgi:predicted metal-dependent hydrolase